MKKEEVEAQQYLVNLSHATNYIFQWQDRKQKNAQNYLIEQQFQHADQTQHSAFPKGIKQQRKIAINREVSEKYDLKKWQKRVQAIKKIQFPIIDTYQFVNSKSKIIQKPQLDGNSNIYHKKQTTNNKIMHTIEDQYIMKKIDQFHKKLENSKRSVLKQDPIPKIIKYVPRVLMNKRVNSVDKIDHQDQMKKKSSGRFQLEKFKKELDKNKRKFSLPHLDKY